MQVLSTFVCLASVAVVQVAGQLASTGASFKLNGTALFVSPHSQGRVHDGELRIQGLTQAFGLAPVTIVSERDHFNASTLQYLFDTWVSKDDVWSPAFLTTVFVGGGKKDCKSKASFHPLVESHVLPLLGASSANLSSGPYFLDVTTGNVHQAYRLYDDFSGTFTTALLQGPNSTFQSLSAQVESTSSITIGVPSRLYFTRTQEKPLSGVRIAVKDLFDLAGVKKSAGNRAWWDLYPAPQKTAPAIQRLIDAGAIIVGTQKMSQFANGATPTADWVDYHAPFNPRGDGYNDPSSSSAGAGAAIASYDWIDIAVGSDTGGSVRWPAASVGVFGNRPSRGLVTLDGALPMSPTLDTAGFLLRDPSLWDAANGAMFGASYTSLEGKKAKYPSDILAMNFPKDDTPSARILSQFIGRVEKFLGTKATHFDLFEKWDEVANQTGVDNLETFSNYTYSVLVTKEQIPLVREPFLRDYAAAHDGRRPFLDPTTKARWDWADTVPDSWLHDARRNKTLFGDWWNTKIQPRSSDITQCTSNIVFYPSSVGDKANPRNKYLQPPGPPLGWFTDLVSCFAESPDSVFPLGQVSVPSTVTGKDELLPVSVDVLVAKGCDGVIAKLAQDLTAAGILKVPEVSASTFKMFR